MRDFMLIKRRARFRHKMKILCISCFWQKGKRLFALLYEKSIARPKPPQKQSQRSILMISYVKKMNRIYVILLFLQKYKCWRHVKQKIRFNRLVSWVLDMRSAKSEHFLSFVRQQEHLILTPKNQRHINRIHTQTQYIKNKKHRNVTLVSKR